MITIISGTNRKDSECLQFAKIYQDILIQKNAGSVKLLALEQIPHDWFHPDMYDYQSDSLSALQDEYMIPAEKFIYISPEYNGSFPGVVKLFIDACSVREYRRTFKGKKAALAGVATGRAGNLRGMDHLTGILNHVGTIVLPNKLPISRINDLKNGEGEVIDPATLKAIEAQLDELLAF
jgi:chromate reductase, NAD(P)H dehydrogenase (quinone)